MKKFLVVILSILYMASATGATLHMHYCMDKLVKVGLGAQEIKKCGTCGNKYVIDNKTCCKDEYKQVKTEKDHRLAESVVFHLQTFALTPVTYSGLSQVLIPSLTEQHPVSHAPPGSGKVSPCILHCVFRI